MIEPYPLWNPPEYVSNLLVKDNREWTLREAKTFYAWFISIINERLTILSTLCQDDMTGNPFDILYRCGKIVSSTIVEKEGFSRPSTSPLEKVRHELALTEYGIALAQYDMGLLIANLIIMQYPSLHWGIAGDTKKYFYHHHPVVQGFVYPIEFDPLRYNIPGGAINPCAWVQAYEYLWNAAPEPPYAKKVDDK